MRAPGHLPTLALGGDLRVPTMVGDEEIKVPAGTQPGARFKLRGKGMPNVSGRGHGDLYVIARVAVPKKLTRGAEAPARGAGEDHAAGDARAGGADGGEKPFFEKVKDIFG